MIRGNKTTQKRELIGVPQLCSITSLEQMTCVVLKRSDIALTPSLARSIAPLTSAVIAALDARRGEQAHRRSRGEPFSRPRGLDNLDCGDRTYQRIPPAHISVRVRRL